MPSHENTLPHADPALAAGPRRSRFLSRSATLLLSLPLAMGTAGFGIVETISPAAAETSSDGAGPARAAERLNRAPVAVDTEDGVFLSWRLLGRSEERRVGKEGRAGWGREHWRREG